MNISNDGEPRWTWRQRKPFRVVSRAVFGFGMKVADEEEAREYGRDLISE